MGFLQDWKEKRKKKRLDEYIQKTAQTEQEKLKYEGVKKAHDEKEALRRKKEELKEYRRKTRELRYGKIKKALGFSNKKRKRKGILKYIILIGIILLIIYWFWFR